MSKNNVNKQDDIPLTYEASIRYLIQKSNQRAWLVASISILACILSIIAVVGLTPLKTVEPYIIKVNATTGLVDIVKVLNESQVSGIEALDKYFISDYIKHREGYYYDILQQDYEWVQLYSSPAVAKKYVEIYSGDHSRDNLLQNKYEVKIDVLSVVLGKSAGINTASVRFLSTTTAKETNQVTKTQTKIATLSYKYNINHETKENIALKNPLDFKVLTYRIDSEINVNKGN